jgi:hypothetical protein
MSNDKTNDYRSGWKRRSIITEAGQETKIKVTKTSCKSQPPIPQVTPKKKYKHRCKSGCRAQLNPHQHKIKKDMGEASKKRRIQMTFPILNAYNAANAMQ